MSAQVTQDVLVQKLKTVKGTRMLPDDVLEQFALFVLSAPEEELFRASPIRYADQAGINDLVAIDLFLQATSAGVFDFSWGTLCPSCGAFIKNKSGLKHVHTDLHCALCTLPFTSDTDNAIEISFTVSSEYQKIRFHSPQELDLKQDWMLMMFSTSIAFFPEVHQILHGSFQGGYTLKPAEICQIELNCEPNHYLFIVPVTHSTAHIAVKDRLENKVLELTVGADGRLLPEMSVIGPGNNRVFLKNETDQQLVVGLHKDPRLAPTPLEERPNPIPPLYTTMPYLTAKQLITNQTFRNLFPKESIPADDGLLFNDLTFMFTDLKGSTSLYDRLGDLAAFTRINQHFNVLRTIIAENRGSVVKTMGDAIMASFATPCDAVIAACVMQSNVRELEGEGELELKVGIHSGPGMAINTNEQLDFFGQTVNIASRIQFAAQPGQILITQPTYEASGVPETIASTDLVMIGEQAEIKGVSGDIAFYRLVK